MPQRKHRFGKGLFRLVFLAAALSLLGAAVSRERSVLTASRARRRKIRLSPRRIATSLAFAILFFGGAAFSAGAGNTVVNLLEPGNGTAVPAEATATDTTTTDTTTTDTTTTDDPAAEQPPSGEVGGSSDQGGSEPSAGSAPMEVSSEPQTHSFTPSSADAGHAYQGDQNQKPRHQGPASPARGHGGAAPDASGDKQPTNSANAFDRAKPVIAPMPKIMRAPDPEPEANAPGVAATIWLHRLLPDPTPPSRRLTPAFARRLARVSARNHVDWALVLGVLRASGERGSVPATRAKLDSLSGHLSALKARAGAWSAVLGLEGRTSFADRTIALQRYYRAVGLKALVHGLEWAKPSLSKRLLADPRISIYAGGRGDIESGRVDIRVLVLIAYLAEAHGKVTVSCLISGHRLYARPGVISAHIYGLAVDISALGGLPIMGHQEPGGLTEEAVRNILLLPSELQPRQVISLLGLGGPSFPLSNHDDHIHVGY